ncbi:hypothetical protein [Pararhodobacter oceanensis]|uniref:Uncharacterized protein n=1 Tax=Pararhodobacter oceanensis TaxID=2172121 RepID=A0A2T8HT20_9RHOB|nr:hypothetical protein [Pararhodobacter oceanensis]PVH28566.1 hypothetical protein DDE20_10180 [Pararhodobacter oceanensis]
MIAGIAPVSIPGTAFDVRAYGVVGQGVAAANRAPATETAQALRPVEPSVSPRDVRGETARDRPVGPPPTFEINVLEDMRDRAAKVPYEPPPETIQEQANTVPEVDFAVPEVAAEADSDAVAEARDEQVAEGTGGDEAERPAVTERSSATERAPLYLGTSESADPTVNLKI